jgi:hypothetical protein
LITLFGVRTRLTVGENVFKGSWIALFHKRISTIDG